MIKHNIQMNSKAYGDHGVELIKDLIEKGYAVECTSRSSVYTIKASKPTEDVPSLLDRSLFCLKALSSVIALAIDSGHKLDTNIPVMLEDAQDIIEEHLSTSGDKSGESLDGGTSARAHAHVREEVPQALDWDCIDEELCDDQVDYPGKCIVTDIPFRDKDHFRHDCVVRDRIAESLETLEEHGVLTKDTTRVRFQQDNRVCVVASGHVQYEGPYEDIFDRKHKERRHYYRLEHVYNGELDQDIHVFTSSDPNLFGFWTFPHHADDFPGSLIAALGIEIKKGPAGTNSIRIDKEQVRELG